MLVEVAENLLAFLDITSKKGDIASDYKEAKVNESLKKFLDTRNDLSDKLKTVIADVMSTIANYENHPLASRPDFKYPSDTYAHPAPLPTDDPRGAALAAVDTPYKAIVQGTKWKGDVKVFDKKFNFGRTRTGHSVTLRAEVGCEVAYLTAESTEAIPILLKGGVGHDHFTVVVKAKPERRLKGRVRAYCRKGQGKRVPEIFIIPTTAPTDTSTYLRL
ncbi:uncharacterized protein LOC105382101 [Plutella xylostella]|uniref:uncharacterized protein LOC105382101 n=1 Tax=Plutella xylostella TaxID=51655 RepID=UPI0020324DE3|nr:uncharacterized protein LOC105382101 [Plutella xylostella]